MPVKLKHEIGRCACLCLPHAAVCMPALIPPFIHDQIAKANDASVIVRRRALHGKGKDRVVFPQSRQNRIVDVKTIIERIPDLSAAGERSHCRTCIRIVKIAHKAAARNAAFTVKIAQPSKGVVRIAVIHGIYVTFPRIHARRTAVRSRTPRTRQHCGRLPEIKIPATHIAVFGIHRIHHRIRIEHILLFCLYTVRRRVKRINRRRTFIRFGKFKVAQGKYIFPRNIHCNIVNVKISCALCIRIMKGKTNTVLLRRGRKPIKR